MIEQRWAKPPLTIVGLTPPSLQTRDLRMSSKELLRPCGARPALSSKEKAASTAKTWTLRLRGLAVDVQRLRVVRHRRKKQIVGFSDGSPDLVGDDIAHLPFVKPSPRHLPSPVRYLKHLGYHIVAMTPVPTHLTRAAYIAFSSHLFQPPIYPTQTRGPAVRRSYTMCRWEHS